MIHYSMEELIITLLICQKLRVISDNNNNSNNNQSFNMHNQQNFKSKAILYDSGKKIIRGGVWYACPFSIQVLMLGISNVSQEMFNKRQSQLPRADTIFPSCSLSGIMSYSSINQWQWPKYMKQLDRVGVVAFKFDILIIAPPSAGLV